MVMRRLLFDTCFLIDLEREMKVGDGSAHRFLRKHASCHAVISWTVAGEFAEGFGDILQPACAEMLSRFETLPMNESTAGHYARVASELRKIRQMIGANDLWIAAAALAHEVELVTRNLDDFGRIPGLRIVRY